MFRTIAACLICLTLATDVRSQSLETANADCDDDLGIVLVEYAKLIDNLVAADKSMMNAIKTILESDYPVFDFESFFSEVYANKEAIWNGVARFKENEKIVFAHCGLNW
ncbi:MAG: hypothetical protein OXI01_12650 [Albidovulum sp.]|nr:hypothetical protein [Albidovulum sp.]